MTVPKRTTRTASLAETIGVGLGVGLPLLAQGVIIRRPWALHLSERLRTDDRMLRILLGLRRRHGRRALVMHLPGRTVVLPLDAADVRGVLDGSPAPFTPANVEKRSALSRFQPHGVLISPVEDREVRRPFNEDVLDMRRARHRLAGRIEEIAAEEVRGLPGDIGWDEFHAAWWRVVRRVTLGDGAAGDETLIRQLDELRGDANWGYLWPRRRELRRRFTERLAKHLDRAEPGSLAEIIAQTPAAPGVDRYGQVPHWLFAFDAAGIATWRALALIAGDPEAGERARAELDEGGRERPFLRGCVHEAVRLWPTTLVILRDRVDGPRTTVMIVSALFHRDPDHPYADRFDPDMWLDGGPAWHDPALVPFSAGPVICPGRNLVMTVTSALLAEMLKNRSHLPGDDRLRPGRPMPGSLDHTTLRLRSVAED